MEPKKPAKSVWISALVALLLLWSSLVYLAMEVTKTVLLMLEYVVDLAQLY